MSGDGGRTWTGAALAPRNGHGWRERSCALAFASDGPVTLMCRATDAAFRTQPMGGLRNEVHRVPVTVSRVG
ncbi:putative molybdenum-binding oxidoreductase, partial [Methylobacterium nodulans]|uniref:Putative molybdenum-binding oxidoreductase n=1 Tax=Methylobacterium nodulans (strain LMG 21967 / CNCM I-2342 / ORS 2060) TaxID=460265 RepID=B8IVX1_METNO